LDASPGDGVCADASSACSLRAAVEEANALVGHDLLSIPAGDYPLTFLDENGFPIGLAITERATMHGAGAGRTTVRGAAGIWSVLAVAVDARIENLTVADAEFLGIECLGISCHLRSVSLTRNGWAGVATVGARLRIEDSAIHENGFAVSPPFGGGILVLGSGEWGCDVPGYLHLTNSTVSRNGAGITTSYGCWQFNVIRIENSTIAANENWGVWLFTSANAFRNTIVANQVNGPDCTNTGGIYRGEVDSLGHNLDSDGTCGLADPTDLSAVEPMLGPLQDNGGPTPTHALLRGSPAIDAIPASECVYDDDGDPGTPEVPLTTDQRGVRRPQNGRCDIGAFERGCGLGAEVAILLPLLVVMRKRRI